jgi:predicted ATPase
MRFAACKPTGSWLSIFRSGGIGKTRLALRLLAVVAAEFPDGAWFIELADLQQPDLVISRIAAVLGVSEEPGRWTRGHRRQRTVTSAP